MSERAEDYREDAIAVALGVFFIIAGSWSWQAGHHLSGPILAVVGLLMVAIAVVRAWKNQS